MAILSQNTIRLPMSIFAKNILIGTKNCNRRFIMTSGAKLDKALENLEKNPFFNKYANKIAKLQQTNSEEFLQRVESQANKLQAKRVTTLHLPRSRRAQSLWTFPFLMLRAQSSWSHVRKNNFSDYASKNVYITTPIFYVNAGPHIGHVYTAVLADALARFNVMQGNSVFLCTGTDEHGTKVQKAADAAGLPTPEYCDAISSQFRSMCDTFQVNYSRIIRTTEERHREAVHRFWNCLEAKGHIYQGKYSGWYNVSDEAFVSNNEIAQRLSENEAVTIAGNTVEWTEEDNYKFRLSSFKDDLLYWLKNDSVIKPNIYCNMLMAWMENLEDLSISRPAKRVPWAIPTPSDESHTIYVWLDALVNYLTSLGYPDDSYRKFWPPTIQVIGKDILKFHGIYWPAFLMAAGLEPPKRLVCHGHWAVKDTKMSKSKGNVVSPFEAMQQFTEDGLRYFLLRQAVLHSDANYNDAKVEKLLNVELADTIGNLVTRCFGKTINPEGILYHSTEYDKILTFDVASKNVKALEELSENAKKYYENYHIRHVADSALELLRITNTMFAYYEPWNLCKSKDLESAKQLEAVIALSLESLRVAALVLHPIIPRLTTNLLDFLRVPKENRSWEDTKPLHLTKDSNESAHVSSECLLFFKKIKV